MRKKATAPEGDVIIDEKEKQQDISIAHIAQSRVVNLPWPKIFLGVTLIATVAGALFATKTLANIDKNIATAKEEARAANIKIIKITIPDCVDCFNLNDAVTMFKKQNIAVGEEKAVLASSSQGQSLIKKFEIKRLPTYIATGEVTKKTIQGFITSNGEVKNNTFIFKKVTPVFIEAVTKKQIGKVVATILTDPTCTQCTDPKLTVEAYKKAGVKITDEKEVLWNSAEGQKIISQYKVTKLPTFLLSSDIDYYEDVKANWARIGTVENDKTYVARNLFLPYRDVDKGQILGLVDLIYLTDSTCNDCYDAQKVQRPILTEAFGLGLSSERTIDVNSAEGQGLVNQYKVTKVPTILLSSDADQYINLKNAWKSVGTVETDGRYVFREMNQIGSVTYKDLASNQVIRPTQQPASSNQSGQ